jgi:hypothetical protein
MEIGIKDKIERMRVLGDLWFNEDKKVFIKDLEDNWYFCKIIIVGEDTVLIECYSPEDRKGLRFQLYWANIVKFDLVREEKN